MNKYYLLFALLFCLGSNAKAVDNSANLNAVAAEKSESYATLGETVAATEAHEIDEEINPVAISVNGSQVHVVNACDNVLEIYNLTGVRVASFKIDSDDKTVNINLPKGCYILKIDKLVRKVSFK